jgi:spore maturation protein CgeB
MHDVKEFRKEGYSSEFLEIGYDEMIYNWDGITYPTRDIVFMANNYGYNNFPESNYRIEMVEFLQKQYPVRFGVYGHGWVKSNGNYNSSQLEEAAMIRGAKIGINLSHFNYERYSSDRILRIMGTGTMCLTKRYKGIEADYKEKTHLDAWDNLEELKEKIDYYLENKTERNKIAIKGNELMLKSFTFTSMIKNLLNLIKTIKYEKQI